ncbi:MAG: hypothetical protein PUE12_07205, partial [Oscillospiraceae bacterium]|nr:hypothetical protein [Oscillospiraceae bacterium]
GCQRQESVTGNILYKFRISMDYLGTWNLPLEIYDSGTMVIYMASKQFIYSLDENSFDSINKIVNRNFEANSSDNIFRRDSNEN